MIYFYMNYLTLAIFCFSFNYVSLYCIDILDQYFSCRHLNPIKLSNVSYFGPSERYLFNGSLNDTFYKNHLFDQNIDSALEQFRRIILENSEKCFTTECNCTRANSFNIGKLYKFYFLNTTYFPEVKKVIADSSLNYTLLTPIEIYFETGKFNALFDDTLYSEVPTLVQYCLSNDFTFNRIYNYKETYDCYFHAYLKQKLNLFECDWLHLINGLEKQAIFNVNKANLSTLDSYYSCRLAPLNGINSCSLNIQRFIALNYVNVSF